MAFAVHVKPEGRVDYVGEVFGETQETVLIKLARAPLLVLGGVWELSDEIVQCCKSECRFFLSEREAAEACAAANASIR